LNQVILIYKLMIMRMKL